MTARPFDERPSSHPSPAAPPETADGQTHDGEPKGGAVAELLQHGVISHPFGQDGEYEVRTTLTTRQVWQFRCCVLHRGKPIKRGFLPIIINHTRHMRHIQKQPVVAKAMRLSFAREAVDVHFTRCAALQEYLTMAMIYAQPPLESRRRYALPVLLIGAACLMVYGLWRHAPSTDSTPPPAGPPPTVQRAQQSVVERRPAETPLKVPRSAFNGATGRDILDGQVSEPRTTHPAETPKAVHLVDLIALENPAERADHATRALGSRVSRESSASDVQAGDLLHLTGWVHRISRAPDRAYHLEVSPSPKSAAPSLTAVVPSPDQTPASPAVRTQLQTVRTFITRRLLRQQEPSPRGSVIRQPIFVQLSGQLSYRDTPLDEPPQGKGTQPSATRWEVHPLLEIQFATPPRPAGRSRPK
jgi:hypothetical protein